MHRILHFALHAFIMEILLYHCEKCMLCLLKQLELVTKRQMENWGWDVNVRPTWFSFPIRATINHTSSLANNVWQIDKASLLRILIKQAHVLISAVPNSIQLMHILLASTKQNSGSNNLISGCLHTEIEMPLSKVTAKVMYDVCDHMSFRFIKEITRDCSRCCAEI